MKTYSKKQINRAGEALILKKEVLLNKQKKVLDILVESYNILDFFRSRHSFPLNIVQNALRRFACRIDKKAVISQRLKRAPSVINKLKRYPEMSLVRMQDIAGCRAVLDNIEQVKECAKNLKESRMRHVLRREDDYILN
ncbi:hypothetical protein KAR91_87390, partial [Candidatus Pacearchaeota archaeon]|nr:hypothetical protein [Candidatus Pacearchaeota archaeon]